MLVAVILLHQLTLWLGPLAWWLDVWTHFQLQYALLGLVLVPFVFFATRSAMVTLVWLCYVALVCLWVLSTHQFTTQPVEYADVFFQNIRYDQSVGAHTALAGALAQKPAEVYAFVESGAAFVRGFSTTINTDPVIAHLAAGQSCAVFVATSSIEVRTTDVWYTSKGDPMCMVAFAEYDLYVAHPLPPLSSERFARTKAYLSLVRESIERSQRNGRTWLVVGDFNSTQFSRMYRDAVGEHVRSQFYTWRTDSLLALPIDHAYSSRELILSRTPPYTSDHHGIAVTFEDS